VDNEQLVYVVKFVPVALLLSWFGLVLLYPLKPGETEGRPQSDPARLFDGK